MLAELRTLGQVRDYVQASAGASQGPAQVLADAEAHSGATFADPSSPVQLAPSISAAVVEAPADTLSAGLSQLPEELLAIVSEKTGYPAEMLELEMDMEADLGIDSIKRVEILGALQDAHPELPEVETDALAELRTLAQVLGYVRAGTSQDGGPGGDAKKG